LTTTTALVLAFILGIASGLRVFTAPAAVLLARGSPYGIALAVLAVVEYFIDLRPNTPPRTAPMGLTLRIASGAFVGFMIATGHNASGIAGGIIGVIGALIGAFGGLAVRRTAIARIGAIPAGITEDIVTIALAAFAATR
jgi:uncharacterized membrane protein